jgi:putative inorganic carbon (hco3(-)) transporter
MLFRAAQICFLLLVFSLCLMQPFFYFSGLRVIATDFLFLLTFALWFSALIFKQTKFRRHEFFWLLVFYFLTMAVSVVFSVNPRSSFIKLLAELYLLSLPVLAFNLIETESELRRALNVWLAATGFVVSVGIVSIFVFYFDRDNRLLYYTLFSFGSLPPGNYPRLMLTFLNANMLCNYLSVSLLILLILRKLGRVNLKIFFALLAGILICSVFTVSAGLGGIALCLGVWLWLEYKKSNAFVARSSLIAGVLAAAAFVLALLISPNLHATAPFVVDLPFSETQIAPSARIMTWADSWKTFLENPLTGRGLGQDACYVTYFDSSGFMQTLTDAHNVWLNVAAQTGVFGLLAISLIIYYLTRRTFPLNFDRNEESIYRIGFGLAFFGAFVYQGVGGSYEDARHLWVLVGFFLIARRLEKLPAGSAQ